MKRVNTELIDFIYTNKEEDITRVIDFCVSSPLLGIDSETYIDTRKIKPKALDPHSALQSLIQVNIPNNREPIIIDVKEIGKEGMRPFVEKVLMNKKVRKVLHNMQFDLKHWKGYFNIWAENCWCTKTLMQSLGITTGFKNSIYRGHRLKDLARDYFDINLEKIEGVSQWGQRPLTNSQLIYAALDVGAPKSSPYSSVLLEGYRIILKELERLEQDIAIEGDQHAAYISSKLEYNGIYVNQYLLTKAIEYAQKETDKYRKRIVEALGFTIYNDIDINEEGEFISYQVIPDTIKTLLNNNKGLIKYINNYLVKNKATTLNSLQADEINTYLSELEKQREIDEDISNKIEEKYKNIELIQNLLRYKKHVKLLSECKKYLKVINPNTRRIHAGFQPIGAATGRQSSSGDINLQQCSHVPIILELNEEDFKTD